LQREVIKYCNVRLQNMAKRGNTTLQQKVIEQSYGKELIIAKSEVINLCNGRSYNMPQGDHLCGG